MKRGFGRYLAGFAILFLLGMAVKSDAAGGKTPIRNALFHELSKGVGNAVHGQFLPVLTDGAEESCGEWVVHTQMRTILPIYGMLEREDSQETIARTVKEDEGHSRVIELESLVRRENETAAVEAASFVKHGQKLQLNLAEYESYEELVKHFYTIDSNTMAGSDQLNLEKLLGKDLTISKKDEAPQILIYHTHSRETFADSVPGDQDTSIVGVGEQLAAILRDTYGYGVLHCTESFDLESRDDAYGRALPAVEKILRENPSIEVVIDLHRDEMAEENHLVMNLDGRPTARFMFFNGLSRTRKSGDITYLQNENIDTNLAFSFQMQLKCEEYYPGLTRKIYLKGYRYNMHLCPRSLLIELGAQNNTVEEAMNACDPLAHVLDMVLTDVEE